VFESTELVPLALVEKAPGPVVATIPEEQDRAAGALAAGRVRASLADLWQVIRDPSHLPRHIPMIADVRIDGEQVALRLRFRIAVLSVRFGFEGLLVVEEGKSLEVKWTKGEPRRTRIRFEVFELTPTESALYVTSCFDVTSLGWLVRVFFKNHPEVALGVHPGSALSLFDAIQRAAKR